VSRPGRRTTYARVLRLRHLRLAGWQAVLLFDGVLVLAVLLVLADLATAWTLLVLPAAVALAVKGQDLVAGALAGSDPRPGPAPRGRRPPDPPAAARQHHGADRRVR